MSLLEKVQLAGAGFVSVTEAVDTTTAAGRMMMQMVGAFASGWLMPVSCSTGPRTPHSAAFVFSQLQLATPQLLMLSEDSKVSNSGDQGVGAGAGDPPGQVQVIDPEAEELAAQATGHRAADWPHQG